MKKRDDVTEGKVGRGPGQRDSYMKGQKCKPPRYWYGAAGAAKDACVGPGQSTLTNAAGSAQIAISAPSP